jgi:hypothetical protein
VSKNIFHLDANGREFTMGELLRREQRMVAMSFVRDEHAMVGLILVQAHKRQIGDEDGLRRQVGQESTLAEMGHIGGCTRGFG